MLQFPNAKINIGLSVTEKRSDGYHNISSVFYPVALKDALEILPSEEDVFVNSGLKIPGFWEDNILFKALNSIREDYDTAKQATAVHLHKHIPMGAGLGGGSADAGFFLNMLNDFFSLKMTKGELLARALKLGSDVPFFINNKPVYAQGRGEILQPISIDLSEYSIQIIYPELHISTASAFSAIRPKSAEFDLKNLPSLSILEWKEVIKNDFEEVVFDLHPTLRKIKSQFYQDGAVYASLTGSGSAFYGIFQKGNKSKALAGGPAQEYYLL